MTDTTLSKIMTKITSLKEETISRIIYIMIFFIIVIVLIYVFYIKNLESKECKYMDNLYSKLDGNLKSINTKDSQFDYTLKDYYIKTAYNCCSGGSYKNDYVSICNLKNMLKQGVRGLDFEIYSINNEPVVATSVESNYHIKETFNSINFADVMYILKNYAFSNSTSPNPNDPIVIHLRLKSNNQKMFSKLASIFKSYNNILLGEDYSYENHKKNLGDVKLTDLMNKIIIIADRSNSAFLENEDLLEYINLTSNSIFMRALYYTKDIKESTDVNELIEFNKKNMSISLPDNGVNIPNYSPLMARECGVQMVAMRYQNIDPFLEENTSFFDKNGYSFVLKPERLRYIPIVIPKPTPQKPELSYATRNISSDYYKFNI